MEKLVHKAFPVETVLRERERELDQWRLGDPIPAWARQRENDPVDQELQTVRTSWENAGGEDMRNRKQGRMVVVHVCYVRTGGKRRA